jgi:hypothetical protein
MVAVVIPYFKDTLSFQEKLSFNQALNVLGEHDIYLATPESLISTHINKRIIRYPDIYFTSVASYSQLMLTEMFYRPFVEYEYILIYQLDCFVFCDNLLDWCSLGYDYIGAPIQVNTDDESQRWYVGNGGLSLRKVNKFISILSANTKKTYLQSLKAVLRTRVEDLEGLALYRRLRKKLVLAWEIRSGISNYIAKYTMNEDLFWSFRVKLFCREFIKPPIEIASKFSIETEPSMWMRRLESQLPFGCHAWPKWDPSFWSAYINNNIPTSSESILSVSDLDC